MTHWRLYIVAVLAAFLVSTCVHAQTVPELVADDFTHYLKGNDSVLGWTAPRVRATALQEAYDANEVAADVLYAKAPSLSVTATVDSIDKTVGDTAVLKFTAGYRRVSAFMEPGYEDWLAGLKRHQYVEVGCTHVRRLLGQVALYGCMPRYAYINQVVRRYMKTLPARAKAGDTRAQQLQRMQGARP